MDLGEIYMGLPYELSGSMSKNRFRVELLWGVSKMLDLMESDCDFTVVFDYVCDVEVHFDDSFEFYQIKTHKNRAPYTAKRITAHALRHTHASLLLADGVDVETISRRLGHKNSGVTKEIYLHVTKKLEEKDKEQIKAIMISGI